jgi:NhaP-type Na+/H+ or K+/H+ antiporter
MMLGFFILTMGVGGLFAALTGRAFALTWRSRWQIPASILLLSLAVRFLHYVMLQEELFSGLAFAADFATLFVIAWFSFVWTRRRQMQKQYGWLTPL